jgi:hypothetical protein
MVFATQPRTEARRALGPTYSSAAGSAHSIGREWEFSATSTDQSLPV